MALEAVLVLVFLLLPGVVADGVYRFVTWRPDPSDQGLLVRATAISFVALFVLLVLQNAIPSVFTAPAYLRPAWWRDVSGQTELAWAEALRGWLQHAAIAVVGGAVVAIAMRWPRLTDILQRLLGRSVYSSVWDEFAVQSIGRWVLVTLSSGQIFYGMLGIASGDRARDVVLHRPMPFDATSGTYEFSGNKTIFIREDRVESVLVPLDVHERALSPQQPGVYRLSTGERVNDEEQRDGENGEA